MTKPRTRAARSRAWNALWRYASARLRGPDRSSSFHLSAQAPHSLFILKLMVLFMVLIYNSMLFNVHSVDLWH